MFQVAKMSRNGRIVLKPMALACLCVGSPPLLASKWPDTSSTAAAQTSVRRFKKPVFTAKAAGVKIYRFCKSERLEVGNWELVSQEATLSDDTGKTIGSYLNGATWKFDDGTFVIAKIPPINDTKGMGKNYWSIFEVEQASGEKVKDVRYVQSIETGSGLTPTAGFNNDKIGDEKRVAYHAEYRFYSSWPNER